MKISLITISDRLSQDPSQEDISGDKVASYIQSRSDITSKVADNVEIFRSLIPDEQEQIVTKLQEFVEMNCHLILTIGGTGFSPRDVTPESTKQVIEREAPGLVFGMLQSSLEVTPHAMLSRSTAGIAQQSVIVNLPGN